ncbi:hypothetical protein L873DRAFT_67445 [Choiromyces venosus 120613-1]|uniref:Uncharacterized protein n=1 Tax=Choiromyces venosus 120613-1 TaxID=1336337 RepID=A0A3N4JHN4_9PEZI|nr:hypothetical protein L873DRAFT_67445 [Choiromyces venosus 120613-1]
MAPKRIQFPTIRPTKHHVPHNFVLASSVSTTPISHRNSYSTTPSRQTRSSLPPTAIQAVISCRVTECPDSEQEKKDAVDGLKKVLTEVTKESFGSVANPKSAYVNPDGATILHGIEEMISKHADAQTEMDKRFKESDKRLKEELVKAQKESDEKLAVVQKEFETFKLTMQPLEAIAIAIRRRFFSNYRKQAGTTPGHVAAIKGGNIAAHHGDVITDTLLVAGKDIEDTDIYRSLYWISPEQAEPYFSMYPATARIVIIYSTF